MASTLINGSRPSFVSLTVDLNGTRQPLGVFRSINYGGQQEPGVIQSTSTATVVGYTPGHGQSDGSFEMLVTDFNKFAAELTDSGAEALTDVYFDIMVSYSSNAIDVQNDKLRRCRITTVDATNQGTDATIKMCRFTVSTLVLNGVVVYGDVSQAAGLRDPYATQRTPVASDFWYSPVYEADNGDWEAPGFVGNTYATAPWDTVQIEYPTTGSREQPFLPGLVTVNVTKDRSYDKKKPKGSDGARVTLHGIDASDGTFEVLIWTPQQWRVMQQMWPVLFPGPQKFTTTRTVAANTGNGLTRNPDGSVSTRRTEFAGSGDSSGITSGQTFTIPQTAQTRKVTSTQMKQISQPYDVTHPQLTLAGIKSVIFTGCSGPVPGPAPFSRVLTLKWVEFNAPGKVNTTNSPKGSSVQPTGSTFDSPGTNPDNLKP